MLLGILVIFAVAWWLRKAVQDARNHATAGPRTRGQRTRAASPRPVSASSGVAAVRSIGRGVSNVAAIPAAFITGVAEQHRHNRGNSTTAAGPPKRTLRQRLKLAPYEPAPADPGDGGSTNGTPSPAGNGRGLWPGSDEEPVTDDPSTREPYSWERQPGPDRTPEPAPTSTNGGTPVAGTSTASAEKLIEGINEIHAHAQSGGIHAKQEAVKATHEASVRFAAMVQMLARQMSEPGQNYGPEITEPLAQAGNHHQAAAMSLSESDAAISTLINMTVGDLARSARQAPHHEELSESGSR